MNKVLYRIMPLIILSATLLITILTIPEMVTEYLHKKDIVMGLTRTSKESTNMDIETASSDALFVKLGKIEKKVDSLIETINLGYESKLSFRDEIVSVSSIIDAKVLREKEICGYVIDNYGLIQSAKESEDISFFASSTVELSQFCESLGITCFYIMPPSKIIRGATILPDGISNNSNDNIDAFIEAVSKQMRIIDLRQVLVEQLSDPRSCFYKGDHHWRISLAFTAFQYISRELLQSDTRFLYDQNKINDEAYIFKQYPNAFIGVQSKKIGTLLTGRDEFELIIPTFPTSYLLQQKYNDKIIEIREGSFTESLVYSEVFDKLPSDDCYDSYLMYGNTEKIIINNYSDNSLKLLVIGDSFSRPFTCYLANLFYETRTIDIQYDHPNLQEYIEQYNPDYVIIMLNSGALGNGRV